MIYNQAWPLSMRTLQCNLLISKSKRWDFFWLLSFLHLPWVHIRRRTELSFWTMTISRSWPRNTITCLSNSTRAYEDNELLLMPREFLVLWSLWRFWRRLSLISRLKELMWWLPRSEWVWLMICRLITPSVPRLPTSTVLEDSPSCTTTRRETPLSLTASLWRSRQFSAISVVK